METYEAIQKRRSVRSYDGTEVPRPVLERLIAAAGAAPSPYNAQPWHFHVATGATRDAICEITGLSTVHLQEYLDLLPPSALKRAERFFASLGGAPVVMVVSVPVSEDDLSSINTYMATGGAIQNLMLAACDEGLACCNLTFAFWVRDKLAALLGIGPDREIVSLILVGHPAETPEYPGRRSDIATFVG
ncbi:MAG TPA: nitroreductase family protein [Coriobacteriia bacterium]